MESAKASQVFLLDHYRDRGAVSKVQSLLQEASQLLAGLGDGYTQLGWVVEDAMQLLSDLGQDPDRSASKS